MELKNNQEQQRKTLGFIPKRKTSIIKVLGVGGGGSNAVNNMFKQGIEGVDFIVCNTDMQALASSPVPVKVQLGNSGLGAGGDPEKAKIAAEESIENIKEVLDNDTEMLFITAGMGGGTGTGAAPVIARYANELGLLTVGIVTLPFKFEGRKKWQRAEQGIEEMRKYIDTLLIISNDKLRDFYKDLSLGNAFEKVDNVLTTAAKGIADIITVPAYVNVDFEDVKTVMRHSGKAIMGSATAEGENRALTAVKEAMESPLLNDNDIRGAKKILLYITTGASDILLDEIMTITDYIIDQCGTEAEIIWGRGITEEQTDKITVTIIATGFNASDKVAEKIHIQENTPKKEEEVKTPAPEPVMAEAGGESEHLFGSDNNTTNTEPDIPQKPALFEEAPEGENNMEEPVEETHKEEETQGPKVHTLDEEVNDPAFEIAEQNRSVNRTIDSPVISGKKENNNDIHVIKKSKPEIKKSERSEPENIREEETPEYKQEVKSNERANKLRELSQVKSVKKNYIELEKEPAYKRKKIQLSNPTYSSDDNVSKMGMGKDSKDNIILKPGASFLHDSVD